MNAVRPVTIKIGRSGARQLGADEPAMSAQLSACLAGTQERRQPSFNYYQMLPSVRWIALDGKVLRIPHHLHDINWGIRVHVRG